MGNGQAKAEEEDKLHATLVLLVPLVDLFGPRIITLWTGIVGQIW
jgi:hypothetical protein